MTRPRWLTRRLAILSLPVLSCLAVFALRGGSPGRGNGAHLVPAVEMAPQGPGVLVEIAAGDHLALLLGGPIDVTRAETGEKLLDASRPLPGELLEVSLEQGAIRLAGLLEPGPIEVRPLPLPAGGEWRLAIPADGAGAGTPRRFRGSIVIGVRGGQARFLNRLSLEEYLVAVVGSEMAASAVPLEALKAQAVASRTYALFSLLTSESKGRPSRFASDTTFQAYGGVEKEHRRAREAVESTAGEVLTFRGGIFRAYFHSTCGGTTAAATDVFGDPPIPPLDGVSCGACDGSRFARWQAAWSADELGAALAPWSIQMAISLGRVENLEVSEAEKGGRARYVRVKHSGGSFELLTTKLRQLLGGGSEGQIRSAAFQISTQGGKVRFDGKGWGHGVGLCQVGAAKKGESESYREILRDYFPGSDLERAY